MYICSHCKQVTEPNQSQLKIVTKKREVVYPDNSKGWEIVKEESLCSECYRESPLSVN